MSGIEGTNQPLSCRLRSYFEALGSMFVEKQTFVAVYSGELVDPVLEGQVAHPPVGRAAVVGYDVHDHLQPLSWASATRSRYSSFDPKRGSMR